MTRVQLPSRAVLRKRARSGAESVRKSNNPSLLSAIVTIYPMYSLCVVTSSINVMDFVAPTHGYVERILIGQGSLGTVKPRK